MFCVFEFIWPLARIFCRARDGDGDGGTNIHSIQHPRYDFISIPHDLLMICCYVFIRIMETIKYVAHWEGTFATPGMAKGGGGDH